MRKLIIPVLVLLAIGIVGGLFFLKQPSDKVVSKVVVGAKNKREITPSRIPEELIRPKEVAKNYDEKLEVSDLSMPLLFADRLNDDKKQFILKDLNLLYREASCKSYNWEVVNPKLVKEFSFNGAIYKSKKGLSFTNAYAPTSIRKYIGDVIEYNNIESILIPNEVTQAYEKAFDFKQKHLPEYEQLADFVYMITEANEEVPIPLHPRDFLYMPEAPIMKKIEADPSLVPKAQKFYGKTTRLRMPSVLEFSEAPESLQKKGITLYAKAYTFKEESNIPTTATPLVYHDGLWKIYGSDGGG